MSRPVVIAGNWKMHKSRGETVAYLTELAAASSALRDSGAQIIAAPPFTALDAAVDQSPAEVDIYAQNMHAAEHGAFTGEISPLMLRDLGVSGVIIGHSERRHVFGETDHELAEKMRSALDHGLRPIFCVGETLEQRTASQAEQVVRAQISAGLSNLPGPDSLSEVAIAYEPVWAIGSGQTATPAIAQKMHETIRQHLRDLAGPIADDLPILYGGSVKPDNTANLLEQPDIDGLLIGGASLEADSFLSIISAAAGLVASQG